MTDGPVILCEPQCWDFEHSRVNASLLHTALIAFPHPQVLFLSERSHAARVRELLEAEAPAHAARVGWRETAIPPRQASGRRRLLREWAVLGRMLKSARTEKASLIVLTSATEIGFFLLKIRIWISRPAAPVLAVMHGVLATIAPEAPRKPFASLRGMRLVFRLPQPRNLRYVALGASILQALQELQPRAARHTVAFELPFAWTEHTLPPPPRVPPVVFGYFGVSGGRGKGFDRFAALARDIGGEFPHARFIMVGHLSTPADRQRYGGRSEDFPPSPLTQAAYAERARTVTYALSMTDPYVYRVGASTSFLDALSSIRPGIYLRNPYLDACFGRMGDIGYLCGSPEEVRDCIRAVLRDFPSARYLEQCRNILTMRRIFEPAAVSAGLRAAAGLAEGKAR